MPKRRPRKVPRNRCVFVLYFSLSQLCMPSCIGAAAAKKAKEEAQMKLEEGMSKIVFCQASFL